MPTNDNTAGDFDVLTGGLTAGVPSGVPAGGLTGGIVPSPLAPHPCPSCGYCPACGRGGYYLGPFYPRPWYPPTWPPGTAIYVTGTTYGVQQ